VSGATLTLDFRPHGNLSLRLEYRRDHASSEMYYRDLVPGDGTAGFVANARSQDTLLAGLVAWF
jgi:hypothetical protein